jgi:hypothetical protein
MQVAMIGLDIAKPERAGRPMVRRKRFISTLAPTPYGQSESGLSAVSLRSRASSKTIEQPIVIRGDAKGRWDLRQRPSTDELPGTPVPLIRCET